MYEKITSEPCRGGREERGVLRERERKRDIGRMLRGVREKKEQQRHLICRFSMLNDQTKSFDVESLFLNWHQSRQ